MKVRIKRLEAAGRRRQEDNSRMTQEEEVQQDKFTMRYQGSLEGGGATLWKKITKLKQILMSKYTSNQNITALTSSRASGPALAKPPLKTRGSSKAVGRVAWRKILDNDMRGKTLLEK